MTTALDLLLVAGLILLALHIATVRDERNAIVAFVSFGLLVALAWLRLASVDVALTEAAIGGGVVGLLLLRAEAQLRTSARPSRRQRLGVRALAVVPCAMVAAGLAFVVVHPPVPAPTLAPAAAASLASLGVGNPVTAVLLAYRALDTLLEKVVLVVALLAVWSLARDDAWKAGAELAAGAGPRSARLPRAGAAALRRSWWRSTSSGSAPTRRAAPFRAARRWPPCGFSPCWPARPGRPTRAA